jgi:hypothetical protein
MAQKPPKSPDVLPFPGLKPPVPAWEPPRPLGPHGRALWDAVTSEFCFDDVTGRELLGEACEALDRVQAMRERINLDGEVQITADGQAKPHPLLQAELSGRGFITRTLCRLGLPYEPVRSGPGRPPSSAA